MSDNSTYLAGRERLIKGMRKAGVPVGVREAITEWRRYNPDRNFLEVGCTVLVEAVFSCSA
jgi:hypothetical protein